MARNDALRTSSSRRTRPFTSARVVARTTQAATRSTPPRRPATTTQLADTSSGTWWASASAAVSASCGSISATETSPARAHDDEGSGHRFGEQVEPTGDRLELEGPDRRRRAAHQEYVAWITPRARVCIPMVKAATVALTEPSIRGRQCPARAPRTGTGAACRPAGERRRSTPATPKSLRTWKAPSGRLAAALGSGTRRQAGDRRRDAEDGPVPEAGRRRGVRVEAGDGVALGRLGCSGPGQRRRGVAAAEAPAVEHLRVRQADCRR